jgi:anti-sigma B factor antagonist
MLDVRFGDNGEIVMSGRLDASQEAKAQEFLDQVKEARDVDFRDLQYISSAGLGVLLKTQKRLMGSGAGLRFINVSKHIGDIFHYSGFDTIFEILPAAPK